MARTAAIAGMVAALMGVAAAEDGFRDDFDSVDAWQERLDWLDNESVNAEFLCADGVATARVPEAGRGMKWTRSIPRVDGASYPYLVVRYRAADLAQRPDYFLYIHDGSGVDMNALPLSAVISDGQWRTLAVDTERIALGWDFTALAFHVQAAEDAARLDLDFIALTDTVPEGAELHVPADLPPSPPDLSVPLAAASDWAAHDDWLDNPATRITAQDVEGAPHFEVDEPARGMKWHAALGEPIDLTRHRFATMRYRAHALAARADYTVAVLGKNPQAGADYTALVPPGGLISDGQWRRLTLDLRPAAQKVALAEALAVQVQAAEPGAYLELAEITLTDESRLPAIEEALAFTPGARWDGHEAIGISPVANADSGGLLKQLRVATWLPQGDLTVAGVPFHVTDAPLDLVGTDPRAPESTVVVPIGRECSEALLLLAARMSGKDDPIRGESPLSRIADVDRFLLTLRYDDGTSTQQFPVSVPSLKHGLVAGPQVVCALADPTRRLESIEIYDGSTQTAYYVAAVTVNTTGEQPHRVPPPPTTPASVPGPVPVGVAVPWEREDFRVTSSNGFCSVTVDLLSMPTLAALSDPDGLVSLVDGPWPLIALTADGERVPDNAWRPTEIHCAPEHVDALYEVTAGRGVVTVDVRLTMDPTCGLGVEALLRPSDGLQAEVGAEVMGVPFTIGDIAGVWHCFPEQGALISPEPASFSKLVSGQFPLQFSSAFDPDTGLSVHLFTRDLEGLDKDFWLRKDDRAVAMGTSYIELPLEGERRLAPTFLGILPGDWRTGMTVYRDWVDTWYSPLVPRPAWFREVFNFRQRFLYWLDPLAGTEAGSIPLMRAVEEAREHFGGLEYLHIFDWGNCGPYGRIYGRTGDYDPGKYLPGGWDEFGRAADEVRATGIPVGFYIEGYLLNELGKLGQAHGKDWQIIGSTGEGLYWPSSTEMYVCPAPEEWQEVQASTYARMVERMGADGMYMDQYGFSNAGKRCYASTHGHPVPSHPATEERAMLRRTREAMAAVNPGAVLYTEEVPTDINSQFQEGAFTYTMNHALHRGARAPINLLRFAFPDFKCIEILYCDRPTGHWATGVKWVFFNGEAIWLEGPAEEWFAPQTRRAIVKCHAILRQHRDAFSSDHPEPLVPTELGSVYANRFPTDGKVVYTLYNEALHTVSGIVLRVPHQAGATYYDAWGDQELAPRIEDGHALIELTMGPQDVGCVVVEAR